MPNNNETPPVTVVPIEHATVVLRWGTATIYADPTNAAKLAGQPPADVVLVTDIHGDHLSTSTLSAVVGSTTALVVPKAVADMLPAELASHARVLANGEAVTIGDIKITAVPMYNRPDADNAERHTKGRGNGYVLEQGGYRAYVAGDTANTPELRALADIDLAFVPMNLPFTMGIEEASDAVLAFKPKAVYPYHYRGPDGLADVNRFKQLVNNGNPDIEVVLANWYPGQ